jgi:hypothetical protein
MARYPNATETYEVAALFADDCIKGDVSLVWPGRNVWTNDNLETRPPQCGGKLHG